MADLDVGKSEDDLKGSDQGWDKLQIWSESVMEQSQVDALLIPTEWRF